MLLKLCFNISLFILTFCTEKSLQRFISEKDHEPIDRESQDYFQARGLILDAGGTMYENEGKREKMSYYQQKQLPMPSLQYDLNYPAPINELVGQQPAPLATPRDQLQQMNQAKLLQQMQQYNMGNYGSSQMKNMLPMGSLMKQPPPPPPLYLPQNMMPLYTDNQNNQKYIMAMRNQAQPLALSYNKERPLYFHNQHEIVEPPNEIDDDALDKISDFNK